MLKCLKKSFKILVLDDVEINVELISNYLKDIKGVKIYKYYNPLEAEKIIQNMKFDILILDIQMPELDGYELAIKIKTDDSNINKDTPIVFVTGIYNNDMDKMKGFNIGSIDYILKPIIYNDFISKIKKYLKTGDNDDKFFNIKRENIKNKINI